MTLLVTPQGYVFPDPDEIESDDYLRDRKSLRPNPTVAKPDTTYRDRDLAVLIC